MKNEKSYLRSPKNIDLGMILNNKKKERKKEKNAKEHRNNHNRK